MKRNVWLWVLAVGLTAIVAMYQRLTGPTYPISGRVTLAGSEITYRLERSHEGETSHSIRISTRDPAIAGRLVWKRHKTRDEWSNVPMAFEDGSLTGELPGQPPAGKLEYRVLLQRGFEEVSLTGDQPIVIRFKGAVPLWILVIHVITIFGAMMLSTRTGLEFFAREPRLKVLTFCTLGFLVAGGMILGPIVQKFAFGAYWTGWPFGTDLTDNKTLIALLAWIGAAIALRRSRNPKAWTLGAAIVLLVVYLIPHSLFGSELDYSAPDQQHVVQPPR